jgi:hypothetical protein
MNDKSSPEELIKYRRYTLKMLWRRDDVLVRHLTWGRQAPQPCAAACVPGRSPDGRGVLRADLQSNGDIHRSRGPRKASFYDAGLT